MSRDSEAPVLPSPAAREAAQQRAYALQLFDEDVAWEENLYKTCPMEDGMSVISLVNWDANVRDAGGIEHLRDANFDAEVITEIKRVDDLQGQRVQRLAAPAIARHAEAHALYQAHDGLKMEVFKILAAKNKAKRDEEGKKQQQ